MSYRIRFFRYINAISPACINCVSIMLLLSLPCAGVGVRGWRYVHVLKRLMVRNWVVQNNNWSMQLGYMRILVEVGLRERQLVFVFSLVSRSKNRVAESWKNTCNDWMGRRIEYTILFECLKPGCTRRYPLDLCDNTERFHHCRMHDLDLNDVREMFGQYIFVLLIQNFLFIFRVIKMPTGILMSI